MTAPTEALPSSWHNWSGRLTAQPSRVVEPRDSAAVAAAVKDAARAGLRVKAAGSGHSFSEIAVPDDVSLRLTHLDGIIDCDESTGIVTVAAGTPLHRLNKALAERGLALENMGDIDRQTISGATATSTHGTGAKFGSISTQIRRLEIVLADGSIVTCSPTERPDLFSAARVSLGALGIVTAVTLQCVPAFALHVVEETMSLDRAVEELDSFVDDNDHFEFFWFPHSRLASTRRTTRLPANAHLQPISQRRSKFDDDFLTDVVFERLLRFGSRYQRTIPAITRVGARALGGRDFTDMSHNAFASKRDIRFNEGEYAIAREDADDVLREIRRWTESHDEKISFPLEVRFVAADDIPLAPTYQRDTCYIAFHQYHRMQYATYFAALEGIFGAVGGRPHWGKMHSLSADELRGLYPEFDRFVDLRDEVDPTGIFTNAYLNRTLGAPANGARR